MRKLRKLMIGALAVLMLCSGCAKENGVGRVDTVVWIPVNPTEVPPISGETQITGTEPTEAEAVTETKETDSAEETKKPSSTSKKPSSKKPTNTKATEPKETKPKETEPKETESKGTEPEATKPAETEPPMAETPPAESTQPPETRPAQTEPMATQPPETESPETEATATEPGNTEPPATEPEATEPEPTEVPSTQPPETEPEEPLYDISGYSVGSLEYGIRDEINGAREEGALSLDSRLCAIASCRANEISRVWSHTRPDGRHYSTVLSDYGYGAGSVTELLVYVTGQGDAASIVGKWLESESHRSSLLSGSYRTIGIGVYRSGGYTYVCCLLVS